LETKTKIIIFLPE